MTLGQHVKNIINLLVLESNILLLCDVVLDIIVACLFIDYF